MDKSEYLQRRRKRYLAQTLDAYEQHVVPHLPSAAQQDSDNFKAMVRQKMNALAVDAAEVIDLGEHQALNGVAVEVRDRLYPHGRAR